MADGDTLKKTVAMSFSPKCSHGVDDNVLEYMCNFRYLDLFLTRDLKWRGNIDVTCSKASRKLGYIKITLRYSAPSTKLTAYKTLVQSLF